VTVASPRRLVRPANGSAPATPVLAVEGLVVEIATAHGTLRPVDGVSWSVRPGEIMALVGESGCGK
jgi:ABC-type glutathione transport system ATPase component